MDEFDVCYEEDPREPMLQAKKKINGKPHLFHRYSNISPVLVTAADDARFSKCL
jgi:hypothetical protein